MTRARRTLLAIVLLSATLSRRLLREGLVVRSLVFPLALTAGTLMVTLAVMAVLRAPPRVAVTAGLEHPSLDAELARFELERLDVLDPRAEVESGRARAGTDGTLVWSLGPTRESIVVEAALRNVRDDVGFHVDPVAELPSAVDGKPFGLAIARLVAGVFVLYGAVIGAAMVARDRDDGSLGAELALPVPRWVHGAARWLVGTGMLSLFAATGLALFDALIGVPMQPAVLRHSIAACATATALGLWSAHRAGRRGFSAALAAGLATTFGLFAAGQVSRALARVVPVASLTSDDPGWIALAVAAAVSVAAIASSGRARHDA